MKVEDLALVALVVSGKWCYVLRERVFAVLILIQPCPTLAPRISYLKAVCCWCKMRGSSTVHMYGQRRADYEGVRLRGMLSSEGAGIWVVPRFEGCPTS